MYHEKLVVAVRSGGKFLKEDGDCVYLPFKSEYSLRIKNLASTRAVVKVEIDGQDVLDGHRIVVLPNSYADLERFLDKDMSHGHRFKFIERTNKISRHRGARMDDGLIRISYKFEKPLEFVTVMNYNTNIYTPVPPHYPYYISSTMGFANVRGGNMSISCLDNKNVTLTSHMSKSDVGITVPGNHSSQQFQEVVPINNLDGTEHVMVIKLVGEIGSVQVMTPIAKYDKAICATCGTKQPFTNKFCSDCGTNLH